MFYRFCPADACRVVEFYCDNENEQYCPACGTRVDTEGED